ncbi:MAG: glycosyltransferase family 2 protein, partial [Zetaproteobacteria bacterium]|nr:glycosyltransferase family 2 protein [Flavobacteriales bacterium]
MKITAIIPTLNEAIHIEEAINSVSFADEIIIIDSFSTDNTIDLAQKHGVKIIQRPFDDYSSQKNFAISQAKHNWIFMLDADEKISPKLKLELKNLFSQNPDKVAYWFHRTDYFMGK